MHLPRRSQASHAAVFAAILGALALGASVMVPATAAATSPTTDTSPVNLSTKINMAAGKAAHNATVTEGDARFEVLSPEVIRLEYSPSGQFLDQPTFTVLNRDFPVPPYTQNVQNGWLVLTTSDVVLRYKLGSGPFGRPTPSFSCCTRCPAPPRRSRRRGRRSARSARCASRVPRS